MASRRASAAVRMRVLVACALAGVAAEARCEAVVPRPGAAVEHRHAVVDAWPVDCLAAYRATAALNDECRPRPLLVRQVGGAGSYAGSTANAGAACTAVQTVSTRTPCAERTAGVACAHTELRYQAASCGHRADGVGALAPTTRAFHLVAAFRNDQRSASTTRLCTQSGNPVTVAVLPGRVSSDPPRLCRVFCSLGAHVRPAASTVLGSLAVWTDLATATNPRRQPPAALTRSGVQLWDAVNEVVDPQLRPAVTFPERSGRDEVVDARRRVEREFVLDIRPGHGCLRDRVGVAGAGVLLPRHESSRRGP